MIVTIASLGCEAPLTPNGTPTTPDPAVSSAAKAPVRYERLPLEFRPSAINSRGDVVGTLRTGALSQAVLWRNGQLSFLDGLSNGSSQAADINDRGVVVGSSMDPLGRSRAVRWVRGIPEDLGTLGGEESAALGLNDRGEIVGVSEIEGELSGFLWSKGEIRPLPPAPGAAFAYTLDINNQGVAVGWSAGGGVIQDATVWVRGVPAKLPSLAYEAAAFAIGEEGTIVGSSIPDYQNSARGVRWADGEVEDLPTPSGVEFSSADDINDRGQVVGHAGGAAIWRCESYVQVDQVGYGRGINNRGQVVGSWFGGAAYLWNPLHGRFATLRSRPPRTPSEGARAVAPDLRAAGTGLCRSPPLLAAKLVDALAVAGCPR
jgi:uncharacterized membrane protein